MATEIPLTRGLVTIVDDEDAEWLGQWRWYAMKARGGRFYAMRFQKSPTGFSQKAVMMHREILRAPDGLHCDHIDNDGLNNQRSNLRLVDRFQNAWNARGKKRKNNLPKGVHPSGNQFVALIMAKGVSYNLGRFANPEDARAAYCAAAAELHGQYARLA